MDPISPIHRHLLLPLFARLTGDGSFAFAHEARRMMTWSAERIAAHQWERTQKIIQYAEAHVPLYRERYSERGIRADDIRKPEDLQRLPVVTKADLRERGGDLTSEIVPPGDLLRTTTGGSTDNPTPFFRDRRCLAVRNGWSIAFREWFGWRPGDRVAWVWGSPQDMPEHPSWHWRLRYRYLHRQLFFPSWKLNQQIFARMAREMSSFRPRIIAGYPSALALFAEYLLEQGIQLRPAAVQLTAEPIYPAQREIVGEAFGAPVFSFYGAREIGMAAVECRSHEGLHMNCFSLFQEFDCGGREAQPGEIGRILATDLDNYGTVLIRYEIGDAGTPIEGKCACGSPLPRMDLTAGRDSDVFVRTDGTLVPGVTLATRVIKDAEGISGLQVVQESLRDIQVRVVKGPAYQPEREQELRRSLRSYLGDDAEITISYVDEIPRDNSGKLRFCISKIGPSWLRGERSSGAPSAIRR